MKAAALLLLVSAGGVAFGQYAPQKPTQPKPQFQLPPQFSPPQGLAKPHFFRYQPYMSVPMPNVTVLPPSRPAFNKKIDPHIIVRPPKNAFAQQQPRTPLAHDLYPDLKLLPTEDARLEPIPITWPDFKPEPIPITWPNAKAVPIESTQQNATAPRNE